MQILQVKIGLIVKFVLFLLPQEGFDDLESNIEKIIPSIDELIKLYLNQPENNTFNRIYNILDKFDYDYTNLDLSMYNKLIDTHTENVTIYEKNNDNLSIKYEDYMKEKIKTNLVNEKKKKENMHMNKKKEDTKFKYITNDIMEDISKFYYEKYNIREDTASKSNTKKTINKIDSDDIRLNWIMKRFDNGKFFFKTLFMNYLKMYQESHNIENLETEMSILNEKYEMANTNMHDISITHIGCSNNICIIISKELFFNKFN